MIAASNSWVQVFDNVSVLRDWQSDALCRLATGGALRTRQLYSDRAESIFNERRPVILNGIGRFITRDDLMSRALIIDLPDIPKDKRRTEEVLWATFNGAHSGILGALLDVVVGALREFPSVSLSDQPRMADFAYWGTAAERGLGWPPHSFMKAYDALLDAGATEMVESSAFTRALLSLLRTELGAWEGTPGQLFERLQHVELPEESRAAREMPRSPRGVTGALQRFAGVLGRVGVEINRLPRGQQRVIALRWRPGRAEGPEPAGTDGDAPTSSCGDSSASRPEQ